MENIRFVQKSNITLRCYESRPRAELTWSHQMSRGPWCTRKDEAGGFSPAGFWLLFDPTLYRRVPSFQNSRRGFSAETLGAISHRVLGGKPPGLARRRGSAGRFSCAGVCRMRLHPQISLPRCELLRQGQVDSGGAYCLRALCSARGARGAGGGAGVG